MSRLPKVKAPVKQFDCNIGHTDAGLQLRSFPSSVMPLTPIILPETRERPLSMASRVPGSPGYRKPAPVISPEELEALSQQHIQNTTHPMPLHTLPTVQLSQTFQLRASRRTLKRPRTAPSGPRKENGFFGNYQLQQFPTQDQGATTTSYGSETVKFLRPRTASLANIITPKMVDISPVPSQPIVVKPTIAEVARHEKKNSLSNIFRG